MTEESSSFPSVLGSTCIVLPSVLSSPLRDLLPFLREFPLGDLRLILFLTFLNMVGRNNECQTAHNIDNEEGLMVERTLKLENPKN
jgi:hypothetical protein